MVGGTVSQQKASVPHGQRGVSYQKGLGVRVTSAFSFGFHLRSNRKGGPRRF